MDFKKIWADIKNFFIGNVWDIVLFFAVLILGIIVIKIFINIFKRVLNKTKMEKITQHFLSAIIKFLLYLILVLALLSIIGINITGIITALSALLLAVGMALQSNIANLANGIVIVSTHMFKKGDFISVDGKEGNITEINFLFTTLMTTDNKKVTLPNSTIVNSSVVNAGANKKRRVDFTFSVAYESDVEQVKKIVLDVMASNGKIDLDPAPFCRLKTLGASSIDFFANCWCDSSDYWDVYYYIIENVYNEFKRANISIPYNQLEVRNRTDKVVMPYNKQPLPVREEKERPKEKAHIDLENADFTKMFKHKTKEDKKQTKKTKEEKNLNEKEKLDKKTAKTNVDKKPDAVAKPKTSKKDK